MRKLLILLLLGSGLWSGYWFAGSSAIQTGAEQWFADAAAQGLVAEKTALTVQGFPNRFDLTVEGVKLADPASGIAWQAPFAQIFAMTWKPWHIIAAFPPEQVLTLPDQALTIGSQDLMASLRTQVSTDLPLAETRIAGTSLSLTSDLGWTLALGEFTVGFRAVPDLGTSGYEFGFDLAPLTPDPGFLAAVKAVSIPDLPPSDLPETIEALSGSILLTLSAPLDRHMGDTHPHPTRIEIGNLDLVWGALSVTASGAVEADSNGYAAGKITVQITNWDRLPALLVAAGAIKPELAPTVVKGMQALASQSPDLKVLSLPLVLSDGQMSFGPFPLGPAPLMVPPES
jgi:hypothetical protein